MYKIINIKMAENPGVAPSCTNLGSARSLRSILHINADAADLIFKLQNYPESLSIKI